MKLRSITYTPAILTSRLVRDAMAVPFEGAAEANRFVEVCYAHYQSMAGYWPISSIAFDDDGLEKRVTDRKFGRTILERPDCKNKQVGPTGRNPWSEVKQFCLPN